MNRRAFLKMSALAAGTAAVRPMYGVVGGGTVPVVRFGVLSDTHLHGPDGVPELEKALRFFLSERVDAVLHCGDITHLGYCAERALFDQAWARTMPPEMPFIFAYGNRDFSDTRAMPPERRAAERDRLILGHNDLPPVRVTFVKGVPVVAVDWRHEGELEEFLSAHDELRHTDRPLVVLQHPHPCGTVFATEKGDWRADDGRAACYLRLFPKAWNFSGHSHTPHTEPLGLWRGDFSAASAGRYYLGPDASDVGRDVSVLSLYPDHTELVRTNLSDGFRETVVTMPAPMRPVPAARPNEFTFVQWNLGHFAFGKSDETKIAASDAARRAAAYRAARRAWRADFLGLCEFSPVFDRGGGSTRDALFPAASGFVCGPQHAFQCNALAASAAPLRLLRVRTFEAERKDCYYLACETEIAGRRAVLVETHLSLDRVARRAQIATLAEELSGEPRLVLSGDFNVEGSWEYAPLVKSGLVGANFGRFGRFNTHRRRDVRLTAAIDNVFVRGFDFVDVRTGDDDLRLSDHRALVCRLVPA